MSKLKKNNFSGNPNIDYSSLDDAASYKLNEVQSILQTIDFFTPIVDDPFTFGQISAANSLSDIYAMGGRPLFALNIVAFPTNKLPLDILNKILAGGQNIAQSIDIPILGGHSIKDSDIKYGMAVTGIIDTNSIIRNSTSKIDDSLILTKPLGSGIVSTAIKKNIADKLLIKNTIKVMIQTNDVASKNMIEFNSTNACTDISGYGLLGHLNEMCQSSNVSAKINFNSINFIEGAFQLAEENIIPKGTKNNLEYISNHVEFSDRIALSQKLMLADAQTSGGLLISINKNNSKNLLKRLHENGLTDSKIIGSIISKSDKNIYINE